MDDRDAVAWRCADYRRYLSPSLDPQTRGALTGADVTTAQAGGRVRRLDWDSQFFGVPAGRIELLVRRVDVPAAQAWRDLVPVLLERAAALGLEFLDVRIAADELALAQALEAGGFRLVDALAIYHHALAPTPGPPQRPPPQSPAGEFDVAGFLAGALPGMEWGRLFAEPRVPRAQAEEFYLRTTLHYLANGGRLTVARDGDAAAGIAVGVPDAEGSRLAGHPLGDLWLSIVAPRYYRRGWGKRLFNQFCAEFGGVADSVEIGTQIQHAAANRIYRSAGDMPATHALTFHRWAG